MKRIISQLITKIKTNEFWKKLFQNTLYVFIGDTSASVINFLITIILIKMVGNSNYGYLVLAINYMSIMDLLINLQCWKSVIQYGQAAIINNNISNLFGYIKLGTLLDVSTAILGFIISFLVAPIVGQVFGWDKITIVCAQIMSFVIISHFSGTPTAILRIMNKFNLVAVQKIFSSIIKLFSIIFLLVFNIQFDIYTITWIYAATDIIGNILLIVFSIYIFRKKYSIKSVIKSKLPDNSKEFTKFTLWTTLSDVVDIPVQYLDVFIVSKLGIEMVSIFKVFKQLVSIISKLMIPIQQAIMPQFSELVVKGKIREAYCKFKKINKLIIIIFLPISVIFGFSSIIWLDIVFAKGYSNYWYVLLIFLISQSIAFAYSTIHPLFVSMNKVFYSFLYGLISNICYLLVAALLVNKLNMIGLIIAYTVQYGLLVYLKNKKIKEEIEGV